MAEGTLPKTVVRERIYVQQKSRRVGEWDFVDDVDGDPSDFIKAEAAFTGLPESRFRALREIITTTTEEVAL